MSYPEFNYRLSSHRRTAQAYAGIDPTFSPASPSCSGHWTQILGLPNAATASQIKAAYRRLARVAHADAGGTDQAMTRLNVARDQAMKECGA